MQNKDEPTSKIEQNTGVRTKIQDHLPTINCQTVANALNVDHRTVKSNLKKVANVDVKNNAFELQALLEWFLEYCKTFDGRKTINKAKRNSLDDPFVDENTGMDLSLYGEVHRRDPAYFKTVQDSALTYVKLQILMKELINADDVSRLIFNLLSEIAIQLGAIPQLMKEAGFSSKVVDRVDEHMHDVNLGLYLKLKEFAEKIRLVEGEKISVESTVRGRGLSIYATAPYEVIKPDTDEEEDGED
ncbi:hypothetical protein [Psittacicella hinzii]|uniref:Uncharacterized protein n=1 Tax=Psittacicella hinzii TaxID=2028575 RepID=A0A3A1YMV1_9GAMM|nr:hypothetical protein [Psittacicella hinzii]RIY39492.1 hypothetical protein CKF58_02185 [Psittacicella hinzii]